MLIPDYFGDQSGTYPSHTEGQVGTDLTAVDPLLLNVTDEEILQEINERLEKSETATQQLRNVQQSNRDYYLGDQLKSFDLMDWQLPSVENRIYSSIEVLIPMVTANPGDPDIHCLANAPGQEDEIENYVQTLTSMLIYDYDVTYDLKSKVRQIVRHWFNYRFGVGKFRLDPMTGKPVFDVIDPRNMILPSKDSPKGWKAEYKEDSLGALLLAFPKAKQKLEKEYWKQGGEIPSSVLGTIIGYYEYWRPSFVAWKLNDICLDKRLNPNWDWDGEQRQTTQEVVPQPDGSSIIKPVMDTYKFRILDVPRDPYFIFNHILLDPNLEYDSTGTVEQAKPLQDVINKRKRQITAVADDSGLLIASGMGGMGIKKAEFDKYDGSPRSTMWVPDGNPNAIFARLQGGQVNTGMIDDLQDSRTALDNLFGTHDVSRGENVNPSQSGTSKQVVQSGDVSRAGPIAEQVENFLQAVYIYDIQMRALYTNQNYAVPQATNVGNNANKSHVFNRNTIPFIKVDELITIDGVEKMESYMKPVPITLTVRRNSTLQKNPVAEYQRDLQAFQVGLMDPQTFYERTGEVNPIEKMERLFRWKSFPFTMLSDKAQQELMPLIMNPIAEPPKRTIRANVDYKDLPPTGQEGLLDETGVLKGEKDSFQAEMEIRQAKAQADAQATQEAAQANNPQPAANSQGTPLTQ